MLKHQQTSALQQDKSTHCRLSRLSAFGNLWQVNCIDVKWHELTLCQTYFPSEPTKVGMDSSSAGLQVPHSLTQPTERPSLLTTACFQRRQKELYHTVFIEVSILQTLLQYQCYFFLRRKLVQLSGLMIGGSACVGHSGIF